MGLPLYHPEEVPSMQSVAGTQSEVQHVHAMPRYTQSRRQRQWERQQLEEERLGTFAAEHWGRGNHLVALPYQAVESGSELDYQHANAGFSVNGAGIGSHLAPIQPSLHDSQYTSTVYPAEIFEDDASLVSQPRFSNAANSPYTAAGRQHQLDRSSAWGDRQSQQQHPETTYQFHAAERRRGQLDITRHSRTSNRHGSSRAVGGHARPERSTLTGPT